MSMQYVRDYYKVPAKRGGRVRYSGGRYFGSLGPQDGTITSAGSSRIMVRFDDTAPFGNRPVPVHPTWELEYLNPEAKA